VSVLEFPLSFNSLLTDFISDSPSAHSLAAINLTEPICLFLERTCAPLELQPHSDRHVALRGAVWALFLELRRAAGAAERRALASAREAAGRIDATRATTALDFREAVELSVILFLAR
jgi:hypothetical protein